MFCSGCGQPIKPGSLFCGHCGTPFRQPVQQPVQQPLPTVQRPVQQPPPMPTISPSMQQPIQPSMPPMPTSFMTGTRKFYLTADGGVYAGARIPLDNPVVMGCDPTRCNLVLPPDTAGVSRLHCTLKYENGTVYIMDHNSTYGTFWSTGMRITPNMWVRVADSFYLGSPAVRYTVLDE